MKPTAKATLNPAVTETEVIEVSPATVTLTLTLEEAKYIRAFAGRCSIGFMGGVFDSLTGLDLGPLLRLSRNAVPLPFKQSDFEAR